MTSINLKYIYLMFIRFLTKTMYGVAAVGLSAVFGYGIYKYVRDRQNAQKIKEAVDQMVY